jgi:putative ABC transporter ATP binding protein
LGEGEALAHAFGVGADAAAGGLGNADAFEEFVVFGERLFFEFGVEIEGFDAAEGRVQGDGFGQVADLAAQLCAGFTACVLTQQHDFAFGGGNQPEYQFDERGLACAVVSGKTDTFPRLQD